MGQFLRARDTAKEIVSKADLTTDDGVKKALRIQGQISGFDLCIDIIFDIVNYMEDKDASVQSEGQAT